MNIAILAGGISPERDVSLSSASLIAAALMKNGNNVYLADVYEGIPEGTVIDKSLFRSDYSYSYKVEENVPDLEAVIAKNGGRRELIGPGILELCRAADVVYIGLHGAMGENGQLQATLDNFNIKYTGSGYAGSLLAMDKDLAKILMGRAGVPVPVGEVCDPRSPEAKKIALSVGLPCVIKPCSCGSSVGISMIDAEDQLDAALAEAAKWEDKILIEKRIVGRELTVAILDGQVLPPIEIIPKSGYYDYKNKYQSGLTEEICPANIPAETTAKLEKYTRLAFDALHLRSLARMDYILTPDGEAYCLEANTLPGMTPTSLLPQAAAAVGISYGELCQKIVNLALK